MKDGGGKNISEKPKRKCLDDEGRMMPWRVVEKKNGSSNEKRKKKGGSSQ